MLVLPDLRDPLLETAFLPDSSMRLKNVFRIIMGIALTAISLILLIDNRITGKHVNPGNQITVYVSNRDIPEGAFIEPEMLDKREIPEEFVVPGSIGDKSLLEGSRATRPIGKGEPFTKLAIGRGHIPSFAENIPEGLRAFSVMISNPHTIAGIQPGNTVDVIAVSGNPENAVTILKDRLVLSVSDNALHGNDAGSTPETTGICLLVTPQEAEILARASSEADICVSLCPETRRK